MLLSEEVYQHIINNYDVENEEQDRELLQTVVNMFFAKFHEDMKNNKNETVAEAKIIFQRLCTTWDFISVRLEKENKSYLKKDGFKKLIESKPEFDQITK